MKQSAGRNLALRLQKYQVAVLRFLDEPQMPFDNNQTERDLRMMCVKRKVYGGFVLRGVGRGSAGFAAACRPFASRA
ncbi:IS66 family transposase [Deinococcus roseus]|uniref:IS66 family transposase n=1 Tax=Deinococcus roseus TaxID=392414 RepID=UPI001664C2E4